LDWSTLWTSNPFPTTNAAIRAHLTQNPSAQALYALDLNTGNVAFVPAVGNGGPGDGGDLPMGTQPAVRILPDGKEVVYVTWRNGLTCAGGGSCDGREDATMGEMVLDGSTVSGYAAGDVRFVQYTDIQTDEMMNVAVAGDTIFHSHWLINEVHTITDRSSGVGATFANPIKTVPGSHVIWRQCFETNTCNYPGCTGNTYCGSSCSFSTTSNTRYCDGASNRILYAYGDSRSFGAGFYQYHTDIEDSQYWTSPYTVISANQIIVKTIDGAIMVFENGSPTADAGQFLAEEKQQTQVLGAVSEVAPQHPIHWNQAQKYFDQFITVRGTVTTVENHLPKAMYLGFTKDIHRTFMFRVFAKDMDKFPYDLQSLQGKTVRVSGVVSLYWPTGSAAEIIVTDPSQIVVESE
jgi:hypothetical protein